MSLTETGRAVPRRQRRRLIDWSAYAFVLPAVSLLALIHGYSIIKLIVMSFQETDVLRNSAIWVGWRNYAGLVSDPVVWKCGINTVLYAAGVVTGVLVLSLGLAYVCQPLSPRSQHAMRGALYLPGVVSVVVTALVWTRLYDPQFGPINSALRHFGVAGPAWLGDTSWALAAIVIMSIFSGLGTPFILCTTAMNAVPRDYYEAASLDGAGSLTQFLQVTLPVIRPVLGYLVIMLTIGSFQVFGAIYVMTEGGPDFATATVVYQLFEEAFRYFDFGRASALSVLLTVLLLFIAMAQFRRIARDLED